MVCSRLFRVGFLFCVKMDEWYVVVVVKCDEVIGVFVGRVCGWFGWCGV